MKIIGHRGARGLAPENTVASIKEALKHDVAQVEIDVRVTKDGVCVINHDPSLEGEGNKPLSRAVIAEHTFLELKKRRPSLATLAEAIEAVNKRISLYIEVKPGVDTTPVAKVLRGHLEKGWRPEDFFIASFSQKVLRELHTHLPELETIVIEHFSGIRAAWRARQLGTKYIVLNHHVMWSGFIRSMAKRGWKVGTYTLNDPNKARRWQACGLYAVVTDYPDRFKSLTK